jgi:hypothetical protein
MLTAERKLSEESQNKIEFPVIIFIGCSKEGSADLRFQRQEEKGWKMQGCRS